MTTTINAKTDAEAARSIRLPGLVRQFQLPTGRRLHAAVIAFYVLGGLYITLRLWKDVANRVTANNVHDYAFFQFVFTHAAQSIVDWDNPFFDGAINAPWGVNMMANTAMLGLSIPLAPITLLFGSKAAFAVAVVIALAGTATSWYFFFLKHITKTPMVAFAAGLLCGFAPGLVSQSNAHPNIAAQFMLPLIISRVIQMKEPGRAVRNGVILGLMCAYQMFLNEELLMYTALVCLILTIVYVLSRRDQIRALWRPFVGAGLVAVAVAGVLMAYPLWFQFFGPQHYTGPFGWASEFGMDVAAFPAYSTESVGGPRGVESHPLAPNAAEENAFLGWPLCLAAAGLTIYYRKVLAVRLAAAAGIFLFLCSLGNRLHINGVDTPYPGPWRLVSWLPLFDSIIVTRMALGVVPATAVILAIGADRLIPAIKASGQAARKPLVVMATIALATIAIPMAPTPLAATGHVPVPKMFTNGEWRQYVDAGGTIMPVPPAPFATDAMYWAVESDLTIPLAGGYFLGPKSPTDGRAEFGRDQRFLGKLLITVDASESVPFLTEHDQQRALEDLKYWNVDLIVLTPQPRYLALRRTMNELLGSEGKPIDGGWMWDVRSLTK